MTGGVTLYERHLARSIMPFGVPLHSRHLGGQQGDNFVPEYPKMPVFLRNCPFGHCGFWGTNACFRGGWSVYSEGYRRYRPLKLRNPSFGPVKCLNWMDHQPEKLRQTPVPVEIGERNGRWLRCQAEGPESSSRPRSSASSSRAADSTAVVAAMSSADGFPPTMRMSRGAGASSRGSSWLTAGCSRASWEAGSHAWCAAPAAPSRRPRGWRPAR